LFARSLVENQAGVGPEPYSFPFASGYALLADCFHCLLDLGDCLLADLLNQKSEQKKPDVPKRPKALEHIGLLINRLPGAAGLPFI